MHLLSFEPSATKFDWKLKEDIDFLKIKDTTYLLRQKVLEYKSQEESKKHDSGYFRCIYFNFWNHLSKTHWELKEDITFLKIDDFFGFLNDDKCQNSKETNKFINIIAINRFYVIAFGFILPFISQKTSKT